MGSSLAAPSMAAPSMAGEPGGASAERLRATIENAIGCLGDQPLEAVLRRTFVRGAPTQEAAAEVLGLPFSTTGATWPRRWSSSPTCCGRWNRRGGCPPLTTEQ
jgi:hypothetical protein